MGEDNKFFNFFADMSFWQFIGLVCFLYGSAQIGGRYYRQYQQNQLMSKVVQSKSKWSKTGMPSSCKGKEKCIVVYVAPWCGACRLTEPTFRAIFLALPKLRPNVGFGIVVGNDNAEKVLKKTLELSPIESFADVDGKILAERNVRSFPTWVITDDDGREVFRQAAAFSATSDDQLRYVFANMLGI